MSEHECIVCGSMHDPERAEQAERALAAKEAAYDVAVAHLRATLARVEGERDRLARDWIDQTNHLTAERDGLQEREQAAEEKALFWNQAANSAMANKESYIRTLLIERDGLRAEEARLRALVLAIGYDPDTAAALGHPVNNDPTGDV